MSWAKPKPLRSDEDVQRLMRLVLAERAVVGRLHDVQPMGETRTWSGANFFTAVWHEAAAIRHRSPDAGGASPVDADQTPVLVKVGGEAREQWWVQRLAEAAPDLLPTIYATGAQLGREELPWIVMERCSYGSSRTGRLQGYAKADYAPTTCQLRGRKRRPDAG